jgi:hypothetical protein
MRIRNVILAGLAGAVAAYLLDPASGRARRNRLRARLASLTTSRTIGTDGPAPLPENVAPTSPQPASMSEERPAGLEEAPGTADDAVIERTVRRKLQERPDLQAGGLVIDVVRGVAYLRGDLSDRHGIDEIVDLTSAVPGVRRVQSLLHLPETETISKPDAKPLGDAWNG